ncbi:class A beta-lactamase-related serine hydrolase [Streptomyces atratus]|uniref:Serine hydrolase n=2 Tax=Streptomyces atratus TaxID=1893 RepID=A0A2Z5J7E7_STRAR|nr:serine hydrolase [Streptomyces atratus]AXE76261.1 serine hydrolase [Streptomyces atratus]WPW27109.1 class A beta-lactamase-related serine hydrolase [Streptomyces atratus]GGT32153.1 serine hydrolase [Streptomyces atratus]
MSLAQVAAAARRSAALPLTLAVAAVDIDIDGGETVGVDDRTVLPVASASKLLLLAEVSRRLDTGELLADRPVEVLDEDMADGTGLLRRMSRRGWTVEDLAWLTASVSDNTATNALLRLVGRESTARLAEELGLDRLTLHDKVRDIRGPDVPPLFATGTARDLARLVTHAVRGTMSSPAASARLLEWMRANTDHGLVPALVDHDPYAPGFPNPLPDGLLVANKTGTDTGVRADAGVIVGARRLAYAVVAHWDPALGPSTERAAVHAIRDVGRTLAACARRRAAE